MASPLSLSKYTFIVYSKFYILCFFGLAASVVLGARGELFCRFVAPAGFRLLNGKVAGRQVDSGAPAGISRREAKAEQAQGASASQDERPRRPNMFIIDMLCSNTFRIVVSLAFTFLHLFHYF